MGLRLFIISSLLGRIRGARGGESPIYRIVLGGRAQIADDCLHLERTFGLGNGITISSDQVLGGWIGYESWGGGREETDDFLF